MQGDGELQQWLHETGKDIGKMVGTHLKKAAKDKAVSYAQEQLGLGLADELGMDGGQDCGEEERCTRIDASSQCDRRGQCQSRC